MTTKLGLYNAALRMIGERQLVSLTESREPRRQLDTAWDDGAVDACLEAGLWNFAMRTVMLDYSPSIEPDFGYRRAFDKPTDFVRVASVCQDEFFKQPLLQYTDEVGFWFADLDTIFVQYVSNDASYGNDLSLWPETFKEFVQAHLASKIVMSLTQDKAKTAEVRDERKRLLKEALNKDAQANPTQFMPQGTWVSSRRSGSLRRDGGSRGQF